MPGTCKENRSWTSFIEGADLPQVHRAETSSNGPNGCRANHNPQGQAGYGQAVCLIALLRTVCFIGIITKPANC